MEEETEFSYENIYHHHRRENGVERGTRRIRSGLKEKGTTETRGDKQPPKRNEKITSRKKE